MKALCAFRTMQRVPMISARAFSNVTDKMKDKERAEEKAYFSKQDAEALKKLVSKLEQRDKLKSPKHQEHDAVCDDLDAIFKSHGLHKDTEHKLLYTELIEWKRHQH